MKELLTLLIILPALLSAQEKTFEIQGVLKGLPDKTKLVLKNEELNPEPLATATSKNGSFVLKGTFTDPNIYTLSFDGSPQKLFIFLDQYPLRINGQKDSLMYARVTGSPTQSDFIAFSQQFSPLYRQLSMMSEQINNGSMVFDDSVKAQYGQLVERIKNQTASFVTQKPASPVSPFVVLVSTQVNEDVFSIEKQYQQLDDKIKETYYGKVLKNVIGEKKIGAVGTDAIDFVQSDTMGNPVSLSSFRGKYVLVDFWASWCKPCRMENPNVVDAYQKFRNKNFTILGVSLDKSREPWLKAISDDQLKWTQVSDLKFWNNEAAAKYRIQSIPQNFLIAPDGKIIARNLRGEELHQKLTEILQ